MRLRTRRRIRTACWGSCCAVSSWLRPPKSTGSCTACATSSPRRGAHSPRRCLLRSAVTCCEITTADPDPAVHVPAAHAWDRYEGACTTLLPAPDPLTRIDGDTAALAIARIEAHYFVNCGFLGPNQLLEGVAKIKHLPCTIVQGRYDIVCPPVTAEALARAWPEAQFVVVPDAGHSVREPGITRELVAAVKRMQRTLAR